MVPLPAETRLEFAYSSTVIPKHAADAITRLLCDTVRAMYENPSRRLSLMRSSRQMDNSVPMPPSRLDEDGITGAQGGYLNGMANGE